MKDLTKGNEASQIFYFTLPMLIGNIFQQFYNLTDSIIVGQALGKQALAAVGASFPIIFLLVALIIGLTMGNSVLISQYYGAKNMRKVKKAIDTGYIVLIVSSVVITIVGLLFSETILRLLSTPEEIIPQAKIFLNITFAGIIFLFGYNAISAVLRGLGDSKTPLYFLMISTVLNVVLVLLFVMVFHWGIAGSAYATIISQGLSFIFGIAYLNKTHKVFRLNLRKMEFDKEIFIKSMQIGLPSGVQQMLVAGGMMALNKIVNPFGTDAIAAYTAAGRLDSFAVIPAMSLSVGISSFVGQNLGAGKPERVRRGYYAALLMGAVVSVATTIAVLLFGKPMISLFNTDINVVRIGTSYLMIVGSFYVLFSTMYITTGVLRGAGDTFVPMFFTLCSLWIIRVPLAIVLSKHYGTNGIWWSLPVAWASGLIMSQIYYSMGRWKTKVVIKPSVLVPIIEEEQACDEWNCSKF
ncbi:MAG: MATE family efflux transporter [bacterium]